jgi:hypothetical protein
MTKPTGAAAKAERQARMSGANGVHDDEQNQEAPEETMGMTTAATDTTATDPTPANVLADLTAQRRALDAQIKAARAAQPKQSALDALIARQNANLTKWLPETLTTRVLARVRLGQPADEALDAVFAVYHSAVAAAVALAIAAESEVAAAKTE